MSTSFTKGVLYVASQKSFTQMAIASAKSLKRHNPTLKVHLFTDQPDMVSSFIDSYELITHPHRRSKVDYMYQSPFDYTLYLDADTQILANITEIFEILQRFDLAVTHAQLRNHPMTLQMWKEDISYAFPQVNSGIILFKKNAKTSQFFKDWQQAYHTANFKMDQVTLRELLWKSDLRFYILPPEYNIRDRKYLNVWNATETQAKILHLEDFKDFFKELNFLQ